MHKEQKSGISALRKGRFSQQNGIYLITAVTNDRIPWFGDFRLACIMCQKLNHPAAIADAKNLCFVVMPDHIHLLLQLDETPMQRVINRLKSCSAVLLNREIGRKGRFWGPGYHDHALRTEDDMVGVARYIVANPLRAGLVKRVGDYPYWNAKWL